MVEWTAWPKWPPTPEYSSSSITTVSWRKSPPAPPYSSGTETQLMPASPAWVHASRSILPCFTQRSTFGANSASMNLRICARTMESSSSSQGER